MRIILIRIQLGKRKSFSFAFNFSNANRSHSYLHFRPPALPALMCESDNLSSKILREAARVCANPMKIYFYRPGGWRELVEVCAKPTIIFRGKARSLLRRSGGRESGGVCANPMGIFGGGINEVNWGNSGMMGGRGQIRENIMS